MDKNAGLNGTEATGLGPGTVAPLRTDGYAAVRELDEETGRAAKDEFFSVREGPTLHLSMREGYSARM